MAKMQGSPVPPVARPAPKGATKTGATVTVACKLPNGLIIRGFRQDVRREPVLGGGWREEPYFREDGRVAHIYGNARPKGGSFRTRVVCGFALTTGIEKDLWDQWLEANKELPAVKNGLVFAYDRADDAAEEARDRKKLRSGLEPLKANIEDDPRVPRPGDPNVGNLAMETDKMAGMDFESGDEEAA